MHPDVHRYLDGELERSALDPVAAAELAEWEAFESSTSMLQSVRAPGDLEARVMLALPPRAVPLWQRVLDWVVTPQSFTMRPAVAFAGAMLLLIAVVLPRPGIAPRNSVATRVAGVESADPRATVYVQFVFAAENAQSVAVAGDFNQWQPTTGELRDADGDGVWTALVAVDPGLHKYMFVVDGEEWVTDPRADSYVDDGFGMRNALIAVAAPQEDRRS